MPRRSTTDLATTGLVLLDHAGEPVPLDVLPGVSLLVLMRHRH